MTADISLVGPNGGCFQAGLCFIDNIQFLKALYDLFWIVGKRVSHLREMWVDGMHYFSQKTGELRKVAEIKINDKCEHKRARNDKTLTIIKVDASLIVRIGMEDLDWFRPGRKRPDS